MGWSCQPSPHWKAFLITGILVALSDLCTKELVFWVLGEPTPFGRSASVAILEGFFYLTTSYNTGAVWGLGRGIPWASELLGVVCFLASATVTWLVLCRGQQLPRLVCIALGLVLGGSLGNGYDRLLHGHVRDFLDFRLIVYDWPVFNLADACLVVGSLLLAAYAFFGSDQTGRAPEPEPVPVKKP
jgi:signal peptidase II